MSTTTCGPLSALPWRDETFRVSCQILFTNWFSRFCHKFVLWPAWIILIWTFHSFVLFIGHTLYLAPRRASEVSCKAIVNWFYYMTWGPYTNGPDQVVICKIEQTQVLGWFMKIIVCQGKIEVLYRVTSSVIIIIIMFILERIHRIFPFCQR